MDVIWWGVPIAGCVALAACVAAALLSPRRDQPDTLRALANTSRLTNLPEYARAARRHTIVACAAVALLLGCFAATVLAAARPTGLPAPDRSAASDQPEDIMLCVGGPATDPAVDGALRYFSEEVRGFGTERIGLTSSNRRLIPLTRDYQYAAGRLAGYARPVESVPLVSPVSYADYTPSIEDVLAMCLTGFPEFDDAAPIRRSLIYVGPGTQADDARTSLFTGQQVRDLATAGGVQVNAVTDTEGFPGTLARDTGGRSYSTGADVTESLRDIRRHPPAARQDVESAAAQSVETPDLLLFAALVAVTAVTAWPLLVGRSVVRR